MKYKFPGILLDHFSREALKNKDEDGHIETLALALGTKDEDTISVQELIFPSQVGKDDHVEDKGK